MEILDLCCCAGGASMGLYANGKNNITGIDIEPQPDYPFNFIQMDVRKVTVDFLRKFDFIWASPPCQSYTWASKKARNLGKKYPDLIEPVRKLLLQSGVPFVIENVPSAPIRKDLILCGEMFGLKIIRHRAFEVNGFKIEQPKHKKHRGTVKQGHYVTVAGHGGDGKASLFAWQEAMQMSWTKNKKAIAEAVPQLYSQFIIEKFEEKLNEVTGRASSQD